MEKQQETGTVDIMIENNQLSKVYHLYEKPIARLKEALSITKKVYHNEHYALSDIYLKI